MNQQGPGSFLDYDHGVVAHHFRWMPNWIINWLRENGQFNTFGVERAAWLAALEANQNPWAEE